MKNIAHAFVVITLTLGSMAAADEPREVTFTFQKGQAVDFLFLTQKPETEKLLEDYFGAVFPIVKEAGYQPRPGFGISQSPTQGNHHPSRLVIASWRDSASRQRAMGSIESQVPDFHQRRRDIWSTFDMSVYEMEQDVSWTVSSEKTYVLTAYWQAEGGPFTTFKQQWLQGAKRSGGRLVVELEDGMSPFGYHYNPDYMAIVEWATPAAFEAFYETNLAMDHRSVQHVNQFILELPPAKN